MKLSIAHFYKMLRNISDAAGHLTLTGRGEGVTQVVICLSQGGVVGVTEPCTGGLLAAALVVSSTTLGPQHWSVGQH